MKKTKVFIAGHKGMVGAALLRQLKKRKNIIIVTKERTELDLIDQAAVQSFFKENKIDQIYLAAAKVGGIYANSTFPAEFIYENAVITTNVIHAAFLNGVKKLLFLGSSCIYPKLVNQPIKEEELLTGKLEPTNEPYAISKILGIKICENYNRQYEKSHGIDYRCIMPTNLYGPGDDYHDKNSHVIPGLIKRFHLAKIKKKQNVKIWGSGKAKRDFLFVDDMAHASILLMNIDKQKYRKYVKQGSIHYNVGSNLEIDIKQLAEIIKNVVGFKGVIKFDKSKPDGTLRKLLNCDRISKIGWKPSINLKKGLIKTYRKFLDTI